MVILEKKLVKEKMPHKEDSASNGEKSLETWSLQERETFRSRYGCEILKHNCTLEEAKDTQVPNDAYIVTYTCNNKICYDLTRSAKRVNIFDMYYDNLGSVIKSIDWGYGKINPKIWGYQPSKSKKRK
jgi:hypothetical protein